MAATLNPNLLLLIALAPLAGSLVAGLAGKAVGPVLVLALQLTVMPGGGAALFGLNLTGSLVAFVLVADALAVMEVSLGFMLLAICRSVLQLNAVTNLGAMMLGGIGGAVTPLFLLPTWAQTIAPLTPAYWAMSGFTRSEERRVGKECLRLCRSRWSPYH